VANKRIRFIAEVRSKTEAEAALIVAGMRLLKPLRVVTLPDVYGRPSQVRTYFRFSSWLTRQDGAAAVE
jgi:hypothetical protein